LCGVASQGKGKNKHALRQMSSTDYNKKSKNKNNTLSKVQFVRLPTNEMTKRDKKSMAQQQQKGERERVRGREREREGGGVEKERERERNSLSKFSCVIFQVLPLLTMYLFFSVCALREDFSEA
jgi:hypothetical protein